MAAVTEAAAPGAGKREPNHGMRIFLIWIVLAVVADLLLWFVLGPHMPPGRLSSTAASQQFDNNVMIAMAAPVTLFVLVYFGYALVTWRRRAGDDQDGPPIHGNAKIQATWITVTSVLVLSLAVFGTVELIVPHGAGGGEGPSPIWNPTGAELTVAQQTAPWSPGKPLVVQVIGQQWRFTYRYPQFGGFETTDLVLPEGQWVEFDVTSLDVIHSFWAYQLGVKADANPGVNNVAFTEPQHLGSVTIRCAELCGLWHGAMFDYGKVVTLADFQAWTSTTSAQLASVTSLLPAYATTYDPTAIASLSSVMQKLGLTGAGGGYYPPQDPAQP
ncbi:MAG TPA: cytochrome c oxidase subunit II [Streptosporangiaceae bacterium]|nr:cytochrome c oxidase subunit II [Streptosporangiaceae bacterium]